MSRRLTTLALCASLATLAGCGSSSSSSSSSSSATQASTPATTQTATTTKGSLKVTTTPKFVPASGPVRSGTVQIAYRNIAIAPDALKVKVGSTIRWTNFDTVAHNVTSEGGPQKFASKDFGEKGTFEIKALKPGVIHYECTIHPASMNGTIEVIS
ncbi:MAG TPA: plastocyanin/azurin family copper-binding protein [Solirubrobacteraceae bacterium]|jgi:plastocyanin|nr:plastocyanin/azurin family copper-binding protein [Solirubrobacteraceae bacterium]